MTERSLKEQLRQLCELQKIDSRAYALRNEKDALPAKIKAIEAAFEEKKRHLAELEKASLDVQKQRKDRELELAANEESRKKLQTQLYALKTNKEYQTMLQQIADTKADASVIEDKILVLFDDADRVRKELEQEKSRLQGEEKLMSEDTGKILSREKEISGQLAELDAQRQRMLPDIDKKLFSRYERILSSRDGLAIVGVQNNSCMGCNMFVPPQVINLIRGYESPVTCEVCNRILFIDDEPAA